MVLCLEVYQLFNKRLELLFIFLEMIHNYFSMINFMLFVSILVLP